MCVWVPNLIQCGDDLVTHIGFVEIKADFFMNAEVIKTHMKMDTFALIFSTAANLN